MLGTVHIIGDGIDDLAADNAAVHAVPPNIATVLAEGWTDTSLPATTEGAIRSGNRAADLLLGPLRAVPSGTQP